MGTFLVGAVVVLIIGLAVRSVYLNRKNGKGCNCSGCSKCSKGMSGENADLL